MQSYIVPCTPPLCFSVFPFSSPAYLTALSMSLTFGSAASEVQSIVQPGLADLCCFVDRIQAFIVHFSPKYCSPSTPQIKRAAWLKGDSNSSNIPLSFQQKLSCPYNTVLTINNKHTNLYACMHITQMLTGIHTQYSTQTHIPAHILLNAG